MSKKYKIVASVSMNSVGSNEEVELEIEEHNYEEISSMSEDDRCEWAWENGVKEACHELCDMSTWIEEI